MIEFTIPRSDIIEHRGTEIVVEIDDSVVADALPADEWVTVEEVDDRINDAVSAAVTDAVKQYRDDMQTALRRYLSDIVAHAESGRLDDCGDVSPTDLADFGATVAVARAAINVISDPDVWNR